MEVAGLSTIRFSVIIIDPSLALHIHSSNREICFQHVSRRAPEQSTHLALAFPSFLRCSNLLIDVPVAMRHSRPDIVLLVAIVGREPILELLSVVIVIIMSVYECALRCSLHCLISHLLPVPWRRPRREPSPAPICPSGIPSVDVMIFHVSYGTTDFFCRNMICCLELHALY